MAVSSVEDDIAAAAAAVLTALSPTLPVTNPATGVVTEAAPVGVVVRKVAQASAPADPVPKLIVTASARPGGWEPWDTGKGPGGANVRVKRRYSLAVRLAVAGNRHPTEGQAELAALRQACVQALGYPEALGVLPSLGSEVYDLAVVPGPAYDRGGFEKSLDGWQVEFEVETVEKAGGA